MVWAVRKSARLVMISAISNRRDGRRAERRVKKDERRYAEVRKEGKSCIQRVSKSIDKQRGKKLRSCKREKDKVKICELEFKCWSLRLGNARGP